MKPTLSRAKTQSYILIPRGDSVKQTGTRSRSEADGRPIVQAATKFGRPDRAAAAVLMHLSVYSWQEMAEWTTESNRPIDVCSRCALSPCAKYGFIEHYSGFNCVSIHGDTVETSTCLC